MQLLRDDDGETQYRASIALGNVLCASQPMRAQIDAAGLQSAKSAVQSMLTSPEARIKEVAKAMQSKL